MNAVKPLGISLGEEREYGISFFDDLQSAQYESELPLAVMITIPEPWAHDSGISEAKRDFYQYYATMMEPWDGPASILFSDGDIIGAVLDRNGLRPSRYYITEDDQLILSSEVGVLDLPAEKIVKKERGN